MSPFQPLFEKSLAEKTGITVWFRGNSVGLVVTNIGDGFVVGKSRELSEIVVLVDRIDGAGLA
jgi:hypothetical protein